MVAVTSIECIAGGAPTHVTVDDQNGDALPPANCSWAPVVAGLTITPDTTGFLFSVDASEPEGALSAQAIYSGPAAAAPVVGPTLTVNVSVGVTALQYTSP